MAEQRVDLKQLLLLIKEGKELDANLILDEGCILMLEDPKPLVKVFNYVLNYLNQLAKQPLEISLDLRSDGYLMSFMVYTAEATLPPVSDSLNDALKPFNATLDMVHEAGKYFQVKISFKKS